MLKKSLKAFIFLCVFDSAKFKFLNPLLFPKKYTFKKRYERHNKTHWTTNFLNFVLLLILVLYLVQPKIKFHISHRTKVATRVFFMRKNARFYAFGCKSTPSTALPFSLARTKICKCMRSDYLLYFHCVF